MFRNLWYTSQFYACSNRVCISRKIRCLSTRTVRPPFKKRFTPETFALEHINSNEMTTSSTLNTILSNKNVLVTPDKLDSLLKVKGLELSLPITKDNQSLFDSLVGISKYSGYVGVYVFVHKATGSMYVGSSNLLRRRLEYYFKIEARKAVGKLLPLIEKDGLSAFKLIIYKFDTDRFKISDCLLLEQYMVLDKRYDLNTARVVNFDPQSGNSIYVYDLSCTILYYHAPSSINLKRVLGIHQESCNKYLDKKIPYLGSFILLSFLVDSAIPSKLNNREILSIMNKERKALYTLGTRSKKNVVLEIKEENKYVDFVPGNSSLEFDSLKDCITYLRSRGLIIKRDSLSKRIKNAKIFHKFLGKFKERSLPDNFDFEKRDLLVQEYKNKVVVEPKEKQYQKNRAILVENITKKCNNIFYSIGDIIKFCKTIGIDLDRKSIKRSIAKNEEVEGLTFKHMLESDKHQRKLILL